MEENIMKTIEEINERLKALYEKENEIVLDIERLESIKPRTQEIENSLKQLVESLGEIQTKYAMLRWVLGIDYRS